MTASQDDGAMIDLDQPQDEARDTLAPLKSVPLGGDTPTSTGISRMNTISKLKEDFQDIDPEFVDFLTGGGALDGGGSSRSFERAHTLFVNMRNADKHYDAEQGATWKYLLVLFIWIGLCAGGGVYFATRDDLDEHKLVYVGIAVIIGGGIILLDLGSYLLPFLSYCENLWNTPMVAVRVFIKHWRVSETKGARAERKEIRNLVKQHTKEYMLWTGCSSTGVRTRIEDNTIVITKSTSKRENDILKLERDDQYFRYLTENMPKGQKWSISRTEVNKAVKFERRAPSLFMALFVLIALTDYIMLDVKATNNITSDVYTFFSDWLLFYTALVCFIMALATNWTQFSFVAAEKSYVQGFFIVTVAGWIILETARWLRPPTMPETDEKGRVKTQKRDIKSITWHRYHPWKDQIEGIVLTIVALWMFIIFFAVVFAAIFASAAIEMAEMGLVPALVIFTAAAWGIMLAPPAPGNLIDICGGFLFVTVLVRHDSQTWGLINSIGVAVGVLTVLHYGGACAQWYIGKMPFAQQWMNRTLPVEMLAASDAVLGDAGWFRVGVVGMAFLDTANGLNQGRIEMDFWTQLFSEWACVPNAISLGALGGTLALAGVMCKPGDDPNTCLSENIETSQAVALLLLFAAVSGFAGITVGLRALSMSFDTDKYIMAREKWLIVGQLMRLGYTPTRAGWEQDVYELARGRGGRAPYFKKALALQKEWLNDRRNCGSPTEITDLQETTKWEKWIPLRYKDHIKYLLKRIRKMEKEDPDQFKMYFVKHEFDRDEKRGAFWDDVDQNKCKKIFQVILALIMVIAFWICFFGFFRQIDLRGTVEQGIDFLKDLKNPLLNWGAFIAFTVAMCVYYWQNIWESVSGFWGFFVFTLKCCPVNSEMETGFLSPPYGSEASLRRTTIGTDKKKGGCMSCCEAEEEDDRRSGDPDGTENNASPITELQEQKSPEADQAASRTVEVDIDLAAGDAATGMEERESVLSGVGTASQPPNVKRKTSTKNPEEDNTLWK